MNNSLLALLALHDVNVAIEAARRKQPKPAPQSADEALKLMTKAEAKRQRKNKARLAREAGNKNG